MSNLKQFVKATIENGGASFNLVTGELNPTTGYMVAIQGHEKIVPNVTSEKQLQYIISDFIREHAIILASGISNEGNYIGTWLHEGNLYLDVSCNVSNKADAIKVAKEGSQLAIWDCANNCEIKTV